MTRYRVMHATEYETEFPISVSHNQAWLHPRETNSQSVSGYALYIDPEPSTLSFRTDVFGNRVAHLSFDEGYDALTVRAQFEVDVRPADRSAVISPWELTRDLLQTDPQNHLEEISFCYASRLVRPANEFAEYAQQDFQPGRPFVESLTALTQRVFAEFEYDPRATTVSTPVESVFKSRRGVCQDFAHLQIAMLLSLGIPARYVSGYVRTGNTPDRPDMIGADASHAWLSAWTKDTGWIDADPTNNKLTTDDHVTIAWGRDYNDIPPFRGVFVGGQLSLNVGVSVVPI